MEPKFKFYEVVEIASKRKQLAQINGLSGAVLGMEKNCDGDWFYAISIFETQEGWDVMEKELNSTGKMMKREDFYSEESVTVEVDLVSGEGKIKDKSSQLGVTCVKVSARKPNEI